MKPLLLFFNINNFLQEKSRVLFYLGSDQLLTQLIHPLIKFLLCLFLLSFLLSFLSFSILISLWLSDWSSLWLFDQDHLNFLLTYSTDHFSTQLSCNLIFDLFFQLRKSCCFSLPNSCLLNPICFCCLSFSIFLA